MESKKLEALLMAVDLGSFTKAAEVLGYTQSGLTHMMNSLEKEIGFPVLVRGRSGVSLTAEGRRIEPAVREFLQANTRLNHVIAQAGAAKGEVLRISAYASIAMHWLPAIVQQFRSECPNVDVDIRMADHVDGPYELLENGTMDAVLPKYYAIGKRRSFPVAEFDGKEFIMPSQGFDKDILRLLLGLNVRPDIRPTAVDDQTVISMVAHGLGVSMMTELTLKGRAEAVMIRPVSPASSRELGVAVRSMQDASAALVRFIDCTQRVIGNMLEK